jgi:P27 family predicted phage terminase small subunit
MRGSKPDTPDTRFLKGTGPPVAGSTVIPVPPCPWPLDDVALAEYERQGTILAIRGRLTEADAPDLALYAATYSLWMDARKQYKEVGLTVSGERNSVKSNPSLIVMNKCVDQMHKILSAFGCTPTDRARLGITESTKVNDPIEALREKARRKA